VLFEDTLDPVPVCRIRGHWWHGFLRHFDGLFNIDVPEAP
jgi:hypothetical protein